MARCENCELKIDNEDSAINVDGFMFCDYRCLGQWKTQTDKKGAYRLD